MHEQIFESLLTKDDLENLKYELRLLEKTNFKFGEEGLEEVLNKDIRYFVSEIIREEMRGNDITISEYVQGILSRLKEYQIIELTISFQPTKKNMQNISKWVKKNIGEKYVIDYKYNKYLIGGAVIVNKGEYRDFSFQKMIDLFFVKEKEKVNKILSR